MTEVKKSKKRTKKANGLDFLDKIFKEVKKDGVEDEILITFADKDIKVKQYLDIESKLFFVENCVVPSFQLKNGIFKHNPLIKEMLFTFNIVKLFTDIDIPEDDFTKVYDAVTRSGLIEEIIDNIPNDEIDFLFNMIDESIEEEKEFILRQEEQEQSFGFITNKLIDKIMEFINSLTPEAVNEMVNSMSNLQNVDLLKGFIEQNKS